MLSSVRRGISYPNPDRSDRPDIPAHIKNLIDALEVDMIYAINTKAARLASSPKSGTFWYETDTFLSYIFDGSNWNQVASIADRISIATFRSAPYSTAPYDGQRVIVSIPVTLTTPNAAYPTEWAFKYNSIIGAWIFNGGAPLIVDIAADDVNSGASNNVWYDPTTAAGPSITTPLNGVFRWGVSGLVTSGAGGAVAKLGLKFASASVSEDVDTAGAQIGTGLGASHVTGVVIDRQNITRTGTRSDVVKIQVLVTNNASTTHWAQRSLSVSPVQVATT